MISRYLLTAVIYRVSKFGTFAEEYKSGGNIHKLITSRQNKVNSNNEFQTTFFVIFVTFAVGRDICHCGGTANTVEAAQETTRGNICNCPFEPAT